VKKEILASLMSSRLWCQVVSINSRCQDVLSVKKVASRCRRKRRQDVSVKSVTSRCRVRAQNGWKSPISLAN